MDAVRAWRPLSDIKMDAVRAWRPSFHNGRRACMTSILCCMRMDAVRAQRPLLHNGRHTRTASIPPDAKWTLCARGVHLYIMDGVHARCPFSPGPKWTLCAHTSIISKCNNSCSALDAQSRPPRHDSRSHLPWDRRNKFGTRHVRA
jgi:hypothetical protein